MQGRNGLDKGFWSHRMTIPRRKWEVHSFLGFTNNLSRTSQAMFILSLTSQRREWGVSQVQGDDKQKAFDKQELIIMHLLLIFLDDCWMYCVEANAADVATNVILFPNSLQRLKSPTPSHSSKGAWTWSNGTMIFTIKRCWLSTMP